MTRSRDIADQQENLGGAVAPFVGAKNKIINGDFSTWQRGSSFSADGYTTDRWRFSKNAGTTATISRQTFTLGAAPVAPYESQYFARYQRTAGAFDDYFLQRVEDARTLANTTSRLSFWAKASSNTTISQVYLAQTTNGTGGGASGSFGGVAITTSWVRYSLDINLPSLSGATLGAGNYVEVVFKLGSEMGNITVDFWGVQWESGNVATPFTTASGSIGGELALCQRYYYRQGGIDAVQPFVGYAPAASSTQYFGTVQLPVTMRRSPTSIDFANLALADNVNSPIAASSFTIVHNGNNTILIAANSTGLTQFRNYRVMANSSTDAYLGFSAEL